MHLTTLLLVSIGIAVASADSRQEKTCHEAPESGMCMAYFPKYYYDPETQTCKRFIYGGCQGNGNRYNTEEECMQNCAGQQKSEVDLCSLEAETGPCRAYFPSYFFNSKTGKCEEFVYGGCGGNDNRFNSEESCYNRCAKKDAEVDLCSLEAETGPCKAYFEKYFFNSKTGKCEKFVYGGCGGNANRFHSEDSCYDKCASKREDVNLCSLEAEPGFCRAYIPSYFFNSNTGKCEEFIYGGCGGNDNRFDSEESCYNRCGEQKTESNICSLEAETGPCRARAIRYYFNSKTGQCEQFTYGGCRGNANRFRSVEECQSKCAVQRADEETCSLEAETGHCKGFFPRYYFNKDKGICELFGYGGCGGNSNNFLSYDECSEACGAP